MLLPCQPRLAASSLQLYPAQATRARIARKILGWFLQTGVPIGTGKVSLTVSADNPFIRFLSRTAAMTPPGIPDFGVLAGNPACEGQRFLVLVFDQCRRPVAVVKTGASERARELIRKEASFLAAVPRQTIGIPKLRATFQSPYLEALALDYCVGDSPRRGTESGLPTLLNSWVGPHRRTALAGLPDWVRLESAAAANDWFRSAASRFRGRMVQAVIYHGDFTPWNIKVSPAGQWTVLDWERGELTGVPGWDWFHYVLQPGILVERLPTATLVKRIETLFSSESFKRYAARAAIDGAERALLLAYLLYCLEVIQPSEGLPATRELFCALRALWPNE